MTMHVFMNVFGILVLVAIVAFCYLRARDRASDVSRKLRNLSGPQKASIKITNPRSGEQVVVGDFHNTGLPVTVRLVPAKGAKMRNVVFADLPAAGGEFTLEVPLGMRICGIDCDDKFIGINLKRRGFFGLGPVDIRFINFPRPAGG